MKEIFLDVLLLSLMASTIGMFWTLCLGKNMVFSGLGRKIRAKLEYHYQQNDQLGYFGWHKVLKGLQCPYCVSIWILVVIHIFFYHYLTATRYAWELSLFIVFFEMGLTTLVNKITSVFINQNLKL